MSMVSPVAYSVSPATSHRGEERAKPLFDAVAKKEKLQARKDQERSERDAGSWGLGLRAGLVDWLVVSLF